jgi:hypothetical protein
LNLSDPDVPNIGSCFVPADKDDLRDELVEILYAHEWECDVDPRHVATFLEPKLKARFAATVGETARASSTRAERSSS